jgi:HPt (histidine-containing phosphotransfer) domain-containing protein
VPFSTFRASDLRKSAAGFYFSSLQKLLGCSGLFPLKAWWVPELIRSFICMRELFMLPEKVYSSLAAEPDFTELLEEFVAQIPERIRSMRAKISEHNTADFKVLVHQLRGACGSYGFHDITPVATQLEDALRAGLSIDALHEPIETFLSACARMTTAVGCVASD